MGNWDVEKEDSDVVDHAINTLSESKDEDAVDRAVQVLVNHGFVTLDGDTIELNSNKDGVKTELDQARDTLRNAAWLGTNEERELIEKVGELLCGEQFWDEIKALEAELATKTCNKKIASKLEDAELARDSEETCNNGQVISKLVASEDCISRQAVLDMMQMRLSGKELYKAVYELPPVTPKQEPCEDTVSLGVFEQVMWERDTAIEQLKELGYGFGEKPKTGRWIEERTYMECPNCHDIWHYEENQTERFKCCPTCGGRIK